MASAPRSASNPASPRISSSSPASDDAMQRAEFVARRIAQIGEIELAETAFAHARRVFDRGAARGDAGRTRVGEGKNVSGRVDVGGRRSSEEKGRQLHIIDIDNI